MGRRSSAPPASGKKRDVAALVRPESDRPDVPILFVDGDDELSRTDQTAIAAPLSSRGVERPSLTVMKGLHSGEIHYLAKRETVIGRSRDVDIRLEDVGVSRHHSQVRALPDGTFAIEDLGSTNGTIVGGVRVESQVLSPTDRIQIGPNALLQFGYIDETEDELARKLYEASTRDPLTRAFNRKYFLERLKSEVSYAARHKTNLCVILLDIDHFKRVNDTHGHPAGDAVLKAVSAKINKMVRPEDSFTRYGGEEFALIARGSTPEMATKFAERVRTAVAALRVGVPGGEIGVTVSLGLADIVECSVKSFDALILMADGRLYQAKSKGRNRVCAK